MEPDRTTSERGFGLVELVVAIIITAVLAAIVVSSFGSSKVSQKRLAMVSAADLVAGGVGRVSGDWPPVAGQDVLADPTVAQERRNELCPPSPQNPACRDGDALLFTRSGAPAISQLPSNPYASGQVVLERGCADAGDAGMIRFCRFGADGHRVQAFGLSPDNAVIKVYDEAFE